MRSSVLAGWPAGLTKRTTLESEERITERPPCPREVPDEPASEAPSILRANRPHRFCTVLSNDLPELSNHLVEPSPLDPRNPLQDRHRLAASAMRKQQRSCRGVEWVRSHVALRVSTPREPPGLGSSRIGRSTYEGHGFGYATAHETGS